MSLLVSRHYKNRLRKKTRPISVYQRAISLSEIKYLRMLDRGRKKIFAKKLRAQQQQRHIEERSAKFLKDMNRFNDESEDNMRAEIEKLKNLFKKKRFNFYLKYLELRNS